MGERADGYFRTQLLARPVLAKADLAIEFGRQSRPGRPPVSFDTESHWIARLGAAHYAGQLKAELRNISPYRLIIVDAVGYIPFD